MPAQVLSVLPPQQPGPLEELHAGASLPSEFDKVMLPEQLLCIPEPSSKFATILQGEDGSSDKFEQPISKTEQAPPDSNATEAPPGYDCEEEQSKQTYCEWHDTFCNVLNTFGFRVSDAGPGIPSALYGDDTTPHTIHIHNYMTHNPDELLSEYKQKIDNCFSLHDPNLPSTSLSKTDVPPNDIFRICSP